MSIVHVRYRNGAVVSQDYVGNWSLIGGLRSFEDRLARVVPKKVYRVITIEVRKNNVYRQFSIHIVDKSRWQCIFLNCYNGCPKKHIQHH